MGYYKKIYMDDDQYSPLGVTGAFPEIEARQRHDLERRVSDAKIHNQLNEWAASKPRAGWISSHILPELMTAHR